VASRLASSWSRPRVQNRPHVAPMPVAADCPLPASPTWAPRRFTFFVQCFSLRDPSEVGTDRCRVAFCSSVGVVFPAVDGFVVEQVHVLRCGGDQRCHILIVKGVSDSPDVSDLVDGRLTAQLSINA
jgi:hypothetical protein